MWPCTAPGSWMWKYCLQVRQYIRIFWDMGGSFLVAGVVVSRCPWRLASRPWCGRAPRPGRRRGLSWLVFLSGCAGNPAVSYYTTQDVCGGRASTPFLPAARGLGRGVHGDLTPELPPGVGGAHPPPPGSAVVVCGPQVQQNVNVLVGLLRGGWCGYHHGHPGVCRYVFRGVGAQLVHDGQHRLLAPVGAHGPVPFAAGHVLASQVQAHWAVRPHLDLVFLGPFGQQSQGGALSCADTSDDEALGSGLVAAHGPGHGRAPDVGGVVDLHAGVPFCWWEGVPPLLPLPNVPNKLVGGHATHTCPRSRASPRSLVQSNNSSTARSSGTIAANTTHNPCQSGQEPRAALMWV